MRKRTIRHSLLERITDNVSPEDAAREGGEGTSEPSYQVKRFMKMVAIRKQQMLEKILIPE